MKIFKDSIHKNFVILDKTNKIQNIIKEPQNKKKIQSINLSIDDYNSYLFNTCTAKVLFHFNMEQKQILFDSIKKYHNNGNAFMRKIIIVDKNYQTIMRNPIKSDVVISFEMKSSKITVISHLIQSFQTVKKSHTRFTEMLIGKAINNTLPKTVEDLLKSKLKHVNIEIAEKGFDRLVSYTDALKRTNLLENLDEELFRLTNQSVPVQLVNLKPITMFINENWINYDKFIEDIVININNF